MRGNLQQASPIALCRRSIPACAGEPCVQGWGNVPSTVYPRVCGGTTWRLDLHRSSQGLSPRVRGNQCDQGPRARPRRSIPACAGEPRKPSYRTSLSQVYPRVCGGTRRLKPCVCLMLGLSPRVRGNPLGFRFRFVGVGSIPACAGEPPGGCGRSAGGTVYPRVCGGTDHKHPLPSGATGLSPRVRGNPHAEVTMGQGEGSIPACAGEPGPWAMTAGASWVYPRVCGGTWAASPITKDMGGLSPRVRGNPDRSAVIARAPRSIPACAGEPDRIDRT